MQCNVGQTCWRTRNQHAGYVETEQIGYVAYNVAQQTVQLMGNVAVWCVNGGMGAIISMPSELFSHQQVSLNASASVQYVTLNTVYPHAASYGLVP